MSDIPALPALPTPPALPLPAGACDCHAHIFGPFALFPLASERSYTPPEATPADHRAMLDAVGFDRGVVVQGSAHGTDNRAIVAAVAQGGGRLKGVAVVDDGIDDAGLAALAANGIAGARFTEIVSTRYAGGMKGVSGFAELEKLAPRLRDHGLHAQLFANAETIATWLDRLLALDVPLVVDHMARIGPGAWRVEAPAFQALLGAVREGRVWVKLTVIRSSHAVPDYDDARPFHEALLTANADRMVFGTDWPLLNLGERTPDIGRLVDLFRAWTGERLADRILVDNAATLYGFDPVTCR